MVKIEVDLAKKLDNIYSEISSVKSDISDVKVGMAGLRSEFRAMNGKVNMNIKKNAEQDALIAKNTNFRMVSNAIKSEKDRKTILTATIIATLVASLVNVFVNLL